MQLSKGAIHPQLGSNIDDGMTNGRVNGRTGQPLVNTLLRDGTRRRIQRLNARRQPRCQRTLATGSGNDLRKDINMVSSHASHHTTIVVGIQPLEVFDSRQPALYFQGMKENHSPLTVGGRVALAREQLRLDQREFSRLLGLSQQAVSKIERGDSNDPRVSTILKVSQVTGVSLRWLITGEDDAPESGNTAQSGSAEYKLSDMDIELQKLITSLKYAIDGSTLNKAALKGLTTLIKNIAPPQDMQEETGITDRQAQKLMAMGNPPDDTP